MATMKNDREKAEAPYARSSARKYAMILGILGLVDVVLFILGLINVLVYPPQLYGINLGIIGDIIGILFGAHLIQFNTVGILASVGICLTVVFIKGKEFFDVQAVLLVFTMMLTLLAVYNSSYCFFMEDLHCPSIHKDIINQIKHL